MTNEQIAKVSVHSQKAYCDAVGLEHPFEWEDSPEVIKDKNNGTNLKFADLPKPKKQLVYLTKAIISALS